jgi:hypothetical protein
MRPSRARLTVTAVVFAGWIAFLAYLALTTTHPVVLSRPQFLAADTCVLAELKAGDDGAPAAAVEVRKVFWSAGNPPKGAITVANLPELRRKGDSKDPDHGWDGPGEYVLALTRVRGNPDNLYRITPIPRSPSFWGPQQGRIYPASPRVLRQLEALQAGWNRR